VLGCKLRAESQAAAALRVQRSGVPRPAQARQQQGTAPRCRRASPSLPPRRPAPPAPGHALTAACGAWAARRATSALDAAWLRASEDKACLWRRGSIDAAAAPSCTPGSTCSRQGVGAATARRGADRARGEGGREARKKSARGRPHADKSLAPSAGSTITRSGGERAAAVAAYRSGARTLRRLVGLLLRTLECRVLGGARSAGSGGAGTPGRAKEARRAVIEGGRGFVWTRAAPALMLSVCLARCRCCPAGRCSRASQDLASAGRSCPPCPPAPPSRPHHSPAHPPTHTHTRRSTSRVLRALAPFPRRSSVPPPCPERRSCEGEWLGSARAQGHASHARRRPTQVPERSQPRGVVGAQRALYAAHRTIAPAPALRLGLGRRCLRGPARCCAPEAHADRTPPQLPAQVPSLSCSAANDHGPPFLPFRTLTSVRYWCSASSSSPAPHRSRTGERQEAAARPA
jgi:hypothetical protein